MTSDLTCTTDVFCTLVLQHEGDCDVLFDRWDVGDHESVPWNVEQMTLGSA